MAGDGIDAKAATNAKALVKAERRERYVRKKMRPSFDWVCALCGATNFGSQRRKECLCGAKKGAAPQPESKRIAKRAKLQEKGKRVNRSGAQKRAAKRTKIASDSTPAEP